jgi:transcriptional regulator with XRE-family HTH domain
MVHPLDLEIGKKIRHRRWFLGITQKELGAAVGVQFQQIQKYETGANRVSASRLWLISKALSLPITFFYEDADGDAPPSHQSENNEISTTLDQPHPATSVTDTLSME